MDKCVKNVENLGKGEKGVAFYKMRGYNSRHMRNNAFCSVHLKMAEGSRKIT